MRIEIPICPECEKELPLEATRCHHCTKPVAALKFKQITSWTWSDRVFLILSVGLFLSFFIFLSNSQRYMLDDFRISGCRLK